MMPPQIMAKMRAPRLGMIRLGIKVANKASEGEHPEEVSYFVLPDELKVVLGEERPTKIAVMLPFDDPEKVLVASYTRYQRRLCTLKCDGRTFTEMPVEGKRREGQCCRTEEGNDDWLDLPAGETCGAEANARLNILIVDGPLGVYQISLGGEQRIADLFGELMVFRQTFGRLTNIVFELERVETEVQITTVKDGVERRLPKKGWPVHIRCAAATRQAIAASGNTLLSLPGAKGIVEAAGAAVPDDEPWTIEACYKAALGAGLTAVEYTAYLTKKYKVSADNLTPANLEDQERILRKVEASDVEAKRWTAQVRAAIKPAAPAPAKR